MFSKISIIMPVYNEEDTVLEALKRVASCDFVGEIIVIDDGSTDSNLEKLHSFTCENINLQILINSKNSGKGSSLIKGIEKAKLDFIAIQDGDLEYDPNEFAKLIIPLLQDKADIVYGSRFIGSTPKSVSFFWHMFGNKILTQSTNLLTNLNLTDMETCQKIFRRELVQKIKLTEKRFGIEPELTIKFARMHARFYEVGISYNRRTYGEGKKIGWKDGISALYCIFKYAFLPKKYWLKIVTKS
jgi:glycosyltransferase involved in cell wall biosynthesis